MTDLSPASRRPAAWFFAGAALTLPTLAALAALGLAPLLTVLAVALVAVAPRQALSAFRDYRPLAMLWLALSLWAMLSASWSILPQHSFLEGLRLLAIGVEGFIVLGVAGQLTPPERRCVGRALALGIVLSLAILIFELNTNLALTRLIHGFAPDWPLPWARFDRGLTTLVLALFPALLVLRPRWLGAVLIAVVAATLWQLASQTAILALGVGVVALAVAWKLPRPMTVLLAVGLVALTITLPFVTPSDPAVLHLQQTSPQIKQSGIHRLLIWRFTADRIAERPVLGWGMDASRELPGGHRDLLTTVPGIKLSPGSEALPLHPHNATLQWPVELGLPGTALCLAIVIWSLWQAGWRATKPARRTVVLGWASAAIVIGLLGYGAWQAWWISCLWLTAALIAGSTADES